MNQATSNPFAFGSPVSGEYFDDRTEETRFLVRRMTAHQNVVILSPRRYGKTSLLLRATEQARAQQRARVALVSLLRCSSRHEVAEEVTRAVVDGGLGWLAGTTEQVMEKMRQIPRAIPSLERDGWKINLAVTGNEDFLADIRHPIELLADSARDGQPVCLILDEFQQVAEIDEHLAAFFKTVCDDLPRVSIVFAGSRRHMMERLFSGTGATLKNVAETLSLEVIPPKDMVPFLIERMKACDRELTEPSARLIYRLMRGIPHFVQMLGVAVYDQDQSISDEDTVRQAVVEMLTRQRADLASRYESLTLNQRKLVRLLAKGPVRDLFSQQSLMRASLAKASATRSRDILAESEYIEFDGAAGWRVSDPLLELWLRHGLGLDLGSAIDPASIT